MTKSPTFLGARDEEEITRLVLLDYMTAWSNRDLEVALQFMTEDIAHVLNIDGDAVPFAASVEGKPALRKKFQLLLRTFDFGAIVNDTLRVDGHKAIGNYKFNYIHIASGERLTGRFRFVMVRRGNLIYRIEEYHDAAYVEAFVRLVSMPRND